MLIADSTFVLNSAFSIQNSALLSVRLRPLFPSHEGVDGLGRRTAGSEHRCHFGGDGKLYSVPGAERERGARGTHAFGNHAHAAQDVIEAPAASELEPDVSVAAEISGRRENQIPETAE